jgi:hypothetical protein
MQHAFGESSDKTICLVSIHSDNVFPEITEINLDLPQKKILYYDIEELDNNSDEVTKILDLLENKNIHYKITISGNFEQFKLFKKNPIFIKLQKNGTRVVFKNKLTDILNKKHLIKNTDSENFQDILLELIEKDYNSKKEYETELALLKIYNQFYNTNNIYNNKQIELID